VETLARGLRPRNGVATTVHGVPASSARARRPIGLAIGVDGRRAALGVAV
jgi:hypothetical protein